METLILELAEAITHLDLAFWGSMASILGLLGILLNTWRLSKVKKLIEEDRFRLAEMMKPFDLYFNLQKATSILKRQQNRHSTSDEERDRLADLLKNLGEVAGCLRQYFREAHKIRNVRDNAYVDAGHLFLIKNDPEVAEEFYERALIEADAHKNKKDISECLQGLKVCSALLGDQEFFDDIDELADKLGVRIRPRNNRFFAGIERVGRKIAFRSQLFVRKTRIRRGRPPDASRLIVQIRSHLSQYEVVSTEVTAPKRPEAVPSIGEKPEIISRPAARDPRI
jgi:tetratricopeptide (TPR) repeat protein